MTSNIYAHFDYSSKISSGKDIFVFSQANHKGKALNPPEKVNQELEHCAFFPKSISSHFWINN